jgi:hypothetical protein
MTLNKLIARLQDEIDNTDMTSEIAETEHEWYLAGRKECAEFLLMHINSITDEA